MNRRDAAQDKYAWMNALKPRLHSTVYRTLWELVSWTKYEDGVWQVKLGYSQFVASKKTVVDTTRYLVDIGLIQKQERFQWKRGTTEPSDKRDKSLYVLNVGAVPQSHVDKDDYSVWRRLNRPGEFARNAARNANTHAPSGGVTPPQSDEADNVMTTPLGGGDGVVTPPSWGSDSPTYTEVNEENLGGEQSIPGTEEVVEEYVFSDDAYEGSGWDDLPLDPAFTKTSAMVLPVLPMYDAIDPGF